MTASRPGIAATRPWPTRCATRDLRWVRLRPASSIFTMSATTPYTAIVIDERDDDQDREASPEALVGDLVQRDDHDLGGQDQVGAHGAGDHLLLRLGPDLGRGHVVVVVTGDHAPHLVGAFVGEERAAEHEDDRQQVWEELAQQQGSREDEQQLVADRADRDLLHDRQLAVRGDAVDVLRRDRRVVDDHARGLGGRAARGRADVVDRCRRQLRDRRDVVEQAEQTRTHGVTLPAVMATKARRSRAAPHDPDDQAPRPRPP